MKRSLVFGGIISALAIVASSYLTASGRSELPSATTTIAAAVESSGFTLTVPSAGPIEHVDDLIGAYLLAREADDSIVRLQIHELVWGITNDGNVGLALLKASKENGQFIDYHRPELYQRFAYTPAELGNSYFRNKDGSRVAVEHISYRVDELGVMTILEWQGRDRDGRSFIYEDVAGQLTYFDGPNPLPPTPVCCRLVQVTECLTSTGCTAGCSGPTSCACSAPAGSSCFLQAGPQCKGACGGTCGHVGACSGPSPGCECH